MPKPRISLVLILALILSSPAGLSARVACEVDNICWTWDGSFQYSSFQCDDAWGIYPWEVFEFDDPSILDCEGDPVGEVLGLDFFWEHIKEGSRIELGAPVQVTAECDQLEICHWYVLLNEWGFGQGGNVEVIPEGGEPELIFPVGGYPDPGILDGSPCVQYEPGFAGESGGFVRDCFDLSPYEGLTVQVCLKVGADNSYVGHETALWFIEKVTLGGFDDTATDEKSWSTFKTLY